MPVFLGWLPLKIYFEGTWRKNSENPCQKPTNIWNIGVFLGFTIQPVISRFWNPLVTAPWKNCESLWLVLNIQLQPWDVQSFPTCQVRVVRFYQSCCPPPPPPPPPPVSPRPCLHQLLPPLPPCQLFAKLFANSVRTAGPQPGTFPAQCAPLDLNLGPSELSAHRRTSTWDLPSSARNAGPQPGTFPAQCAPLDLNLGPSQLSAHRWTSTWDLPSSVRTAGPQPDLPSSVRTAGPQPGTFPAQCAPLDLNLGPSQLSAHRWTSTWDLPSSVRTAGPQRPDRMPEDMPDRMSDRMPEDMPDKMP